MRASVFFASAAALCLVQASAARPAHACGGCFAPPTEVTVVTAHRMAFEITTKQTILWDQIQYSGAPQNFAWVLPVRPGAVIQLSHDDWFAALDALTNPTITAPPASSCGGSSFGCGSSSSASVAGYSGESGVQVISQGVIGPYDQATLHSTNPTALYDWLVANSYAVPDALRPTIDAYVAGGFDFIALRLAPGQGVQAMQPVRVVTPGAGVTLPLRMVAAGVGASVGIVLYVLGEGRYEARNFPNALVDPDKLVWLTATASSNYQQLATAAMQGGGGRTWLTEFSGQVALDGTPTYDPSGFSCSSQGGGAGGGVFNTVGGSFSDLYYAQCQCNAGGACDADAGAGQDAGASGDGGACAACDAYDDLSIAQQGATPGSTWVTRLRAVLPASALSGDLDVQAAASQQPVSNQLVAKVYDDPTTNPCGTSGSSGKAGCTAAPEDPASGRWLTAGSLALLGLVLARRRRARR